MYDWTTTNGTRYTFQIMNENTNSFINFIFEGKIHFPNCITCNWTGRMLRQQNIPVFPLAAVTVKIT